MRSQQFKMFSIKYILHPAAQSSYFAWHFYQELNWFQPRWHSLQVKTIFSEISGMFRSDVLSLLLLMWPVMFNWPFFFFLEGKGVSTHFDWLFLKANGFLWQTRSWTAIHGYYTNNNKLLHRLFLWIPTCLGSFIILWQRHFWNAAVLSLVKTDSFALIVPINEH